MNTPFLAGILKAVTGVILSVSSEWASSLGLRFRSGLGWTFAGYAVARGSGLVLSFLLARVLSANDYGRYGLLVGSVIMVQVLAAGGLGMAATRHVAHLRDSNANEIPTAVRFLIQLSLLLGSLVALLLLAFAPQIAHHLLGLEDRSNCVYPLAVSFLFTMVDAVQVGVLSGYEEFPSLARIAVATAVVTTVSTSIGVMAYGLVGACYAQLITGACQCLLNRRRMSQLRCRQLAIESPRGSGSRLRLTTDFALPGFLGAALFAPINWACSLVLSKGPSGWAEMAVFNAANQWHLAICFLPLLTGRIALPILANSAGTDADLLRRALRLNLLLSCGAAVVLAIPVCVMSPLIMSGYGRRFQGGASVLIVMAIWAVVKAVNQVYGYLLASLDKMWFGVLSNLALALLTIAGSLILTPSFGALGLAAAMAAASAAQLLWQTVLLYPTLKTGSWRPAAVPALGSGGA